MNTLILILYFNLKNSNLRKGKGIYKSKEGYIFLHKNEISLKLSHIAIINMRSSFTNLLNEI